MMGFHGRSRAVAELSVAAPAAATAQVLASAATRPIRVAVVTPYYPPRLGGVERYAERVVHVLRESPHHEPVLITSSSSRRTTYSIEDGVPVVRLGTWFVLSNSPVSPAWVWQVRRWLRRLDVDIVNAHAPVPFLADVTAFAAGSRPVVLTYHAGTLAKGARVDPLLRLYEKVVLTRVFRRCQGLIAVSPASLNYRFGATLIPGGVDLTRFTAPARYATPQRLLFVGRIEKSSRWKGLQVLLEAMPRILRQAPLTRLSVVGEGDDLAHMRQEAERLGIAGSVDWHAGLHGEALVNAYRAASALVIPSLTDAENSPLVLLEAKACGIPAIASRVGGLPYMIRDGVDGLLAPPGDPEALAAACLQLLLDPARAEEKGRAARESAEDTWSWSRQEVKAVEMLDQTLARARSTGERAGQRRRRRRQKRR